MKKFIAAAAAVALAFAMAVPAFAATAPEGYNNKPTEVVDEITLTVESGQTATKLAPEVAEQKALEAVNDANVVAGLTAIGLDAEQIRVVGSYEITGQAGTLVFAIPDVTLANDEKLVALHQKADGSWEVIDMTLNADGNWEGTFGELSPVLFSVVKAIVGPTDPTNPTNPTDPTDPTVPTPSTPADVTEPTPSTPAIYPQDLTKSPKTGEANAVAVIRGALA